MLSQAARGRSVFRGESEEANLSSHGLVAQLVEHRVTYRAYAGSNPALSIGGR